MMVNSTIIAIPVRKQSSSIVTLSVDDVPLVKPFVTSSVFVEDINSPPPKVHLTIPSVPMQT